jgi:hypothetical protein
MKNLATIAAQLTLNSKATIAAQSGLHSNVAVLIGFFPSIFSKKNRSPLIKEACALREGRVQDWLTLGALFP